MQKRHLKVSPHPAQTASEYLLILAARTREILEILEQLAIVLIGLTEPGSEAEITVSEQLDLIRVKLERLNRLIDTNPPNEIHT
jgi:hypothetical protein